MEFIKVRNVKDPVRNAQENAGIDFYIPEVDSFTSDEIKKFGDGVSIYDNKIFIQPHCDVLIPSGIMSKFSSNLALVAHNKSGIATKKKLVAGATVIDASYQGEWHFHLINTSDSVQCMEFGQKIIQFIPLIISTEDVVIKNMSPEEFFTETTSRGAGGFGSTGV